MSNSSNQISSDDEELGSYSDRAFDDEGTLDEEELLSADEVYANDELKLLQDDANLCIDELRQRYCEHDSDSDKAECSSYLMHSKQLVDVDTKQGVNDETAHTDLSDQSAYFAGDEENDDSEYIPPECVRKHVHIGPFFQAIIPKHVPSSSAIKHDESEVLWSPYSELSDVSLMSYLQTYYEAVSGATESSSRSITTQQPIRDDEKALKALLDANYDLNEAINRILSQKLNAPGKTVGPNPAKWSEEDCDLFENGIVEYGKNFFEVRRTMLPHRTTGELVQFYYVWKKTERYDMFHERLKAMRTYPVDQMSGSVDSFGNLSGSDAASFIPSPVHVISAVTCGGLNISLSKDWVHDWTSTDNASLPHLENGSLSNVFH